MTSSLGSATANDGLPSSIQYVGFNLHAIYKAKQILNFLHSSSKLYNKNMENSSLTLNIENAMKTLNVNHFGYEDLNKKFTYRIQSMGNGLGGSLADQKNIYAAWEYLNRMIARESSSQTEKALFNAEQTMNTIQPKPLEITPSNLNKRFKNASSSVVAKKDQHTSPKQNKKSVKQSDLSTSKHENTRMPVGKIHQTQSSRTNLPNKAAVKGRSIELVTSSKNINQNIANSHTQQNKACTTIKKLIKKPESSSLHDGLNAKSTTTMPYNSSLINSSTAIPLPKLRQLTKQMSKESAQKQQKIARKALWKQKTGELLSNGKIKPQIESIKAPLQDPVLKKKDIFKGSTEQNDFKKPARNRKISGTNDHNLQSYAFERIRDWVESS